MKYLVVIPLLICCLSCSTIIKSVAGGLVSGVYQQNDLTLVKDGAPAYLIIVEGAIYGSPDNRDLLLTGIQMFSAYSGAFVEDKERQSLFNAKVTKWGDMLLKTYPKYKIYDSIPFSEKERKEKAFSDFVKSINKSDIPYVFWGIYSQAMSVLSDLSSPEALMIIPKALAIIDRVYKLDDTYYYGIPHLVYGVYYSAYPEGLGGDPVKSKQEFDKAIEISGGKLLLFKYMFAESYCKSQYDKETYVKIMNEISQFDVDKYPETRLMNILAKKQAIKSLASVDEYFY